MTHWDSNGHVNDDVTLPRKVKVMTPNIFGAHYLDDGWRYGLGANRARIGNDNWELTGHVNDDVV